MGLAWCSALTGYSECGALIRITGDIAQTDISWYSALHNGYLTILILWNNLYISSNNKPNSNIIIFINIFYVIFILSPHYNAVSDLQRYRYLVVEHRSWFVFLSWLYRESAKLILQLTQNQIFPESKPRKNIVKCT